MRFVLFQWARPRMTRVFLRKLHVALESYLLCFVPPRVACLLLPRAFRPLGVRATSRPMETTLIRHRRLRVWWYAHTQRPRCSQSCGHGGDNRRTGSSGGWRQAAATAGPAHQPVLAFREDSLSVTASRVPAHQPDRVSAECQADVTGSPVADGIEPQSGCCGVETKGHGRSY